MHLHRFERIWIYVGAATMGAFFVTMAVLSLAAGIDPPSAVRSVDPSQLNATEPFNHPGLHRTGTNRYDAYYVGQVFSWAPAKLTVPRGATVTFYVTSADVVHGFTIPREDVNVEVMPGWVSTVMHTFKHPGTYLLLCNQYCGIGHHEMAASIEVTP